MVVRYRTEILTLMRYMEDLNLDCRKQEDLPKEKEKHLCPRRMQRVRPELNDRGY